jgi:hypothetical protein
MGKKTSTEDGPVMDGHKFLPAVKYVSFRNEYFHSFLPLLVWKTLITSFLGQPLSYIWGLEKFSNLFSSRS